MYGCLNPHAPSRDCEFLSIENNQWVFFPSTGRRAQDRVRLKRAVQYRESVGDFSYEDLGGGSWEEKYEFTVRDENDETWVLEGIQIEESTYSRILVTIGKLRYMVTKVEYYKGLEHFKDLFFTDVKKFADRP